MKRLFLILILLSTTISFSAEIDACTFDEYVLGMFNEIAVSRDTTRHLELLDFVAEYGHKADPEICAIESRREKLVRIAYTLYDEKKGEHEYNDVYTKYAFIANREINGRTITEEDNAMYNMLLDYMIAKYDSWFAYEKKEMLENAPLSTTVFAELILNKLISKNQIAGFASKIGKPPSDAALDLMQSWAGLWFQNESPIGRHTKFDNDYTWILQARNNFLDKYPESRYKEAIETIMDDDVCNKLRDYDKEDGVFSFGITLSLGKALMTSAFDNVDETFSIGFPQGRLQINHLVFQIQLDAIFNGSKLKQVAFNGLSGYAFEFGNYGIDVMGGLGYAQFMLNGDSTDNLAYLGSIQFVKRLPVGDLLHISPKFQWLAKVIHFDDPIDDRKKWGMVNQFLIGFTFEARQPLSRLNVKDYGKKHESVRRTNLGD